MMTHCTKAWLWLSSINFAYTKYTKLGLFLPKTRFKGNFDIFLNGGVRRWQTLSPFFTNQSGSWLPPLRSYQSHNREVPRWEIFMEQELRFGLDLCWLTVLKKRVWANYEQLLRAFLSCFQGQIKILKFFCLKLL